VESTGGRVPRIQLLHALGCADANTEAAYGALREALGAVGLDGAAVDDVLIETEEQSEAHGMVGGPAIMVDGVDVDPNVRGMRTGGLGCRAYITPEGISPAPPVAMIVAALQAAMTGE
jgi:hypothetical protein